MLDAAVDRRLQALDRPRELEPLEPRRAGAGRSVSSSTRARCAPMQKCSPKPNARCGFGSRSTRNANGSSNTVLVAVRRREVQRELIAGRGSSRRATSQSSVATRVKWLIGLTQRRISSTASGSSSGSVAELLPLVGVLAEREQAAADRVAGRLVAGLDEQLAVRDELLLGERRAVDRAARAARSRDRRCGSRAALAR